MEHKEQTNLALDVQKPIAKEPKTIISINGVIIISKLNPAAKEFYPTNVWQQYVTGSDSNEQFVQPYKQMQSFDQLVIGTEQSDHKELAIEENLVKTQNKDQTHVESKDGMIQAVKSFSVFMEQDKTDDGKKESDYLITGMQKKDLKGLMTNTIDHPITMESIKLVNTKLDCFKEKICCINNAKHSTSENPTNRGEEKEVPKPVSKNISEIQTEYTDKMTMITVEAGGDVNHISTGELQKVIDFDEIGKQQNNMETNKTTQNQNMSELNIECNVPANVTTEKLSENTVESGVNTESKMDIEKVVEENKRKGRKMGLGKLTKMVLGTSSKSSSKDKSGTKPSTMMSRTKRISESFHSISSSFKCRADVKKPESSLRLLPRTSKRSSVCSLAISNKSKHCIGLTKVVKTSAHDIKSLKSTRSTERSLTSRSAEHSTSTLNKKPCSASNKTPSTTTIKKSKETKLPRCTLASTLRQNEAQKRRNLFPMEDAKSNSNIDLSEFLFK